jgi:protein TonB
MNETMYINGNFEQMLQGALHERRLLAAAPAGLEQRLLARLAQEERREAAIFGFAERVRTPRSATSMWFAIGAHAVVLLLLFGLVARQVVRAPRELALTQMMVPPVPPPIAPKARQIGGGGGQHDLAPVTVGHLPKMAETQIVPPKAPPTIAPKLAVDPAVVVQKDLKMADNTMPNLGAPNSTLNGFSMGNGIGTGIGSGDGNGFGAGSGGNTGGGVFHLGGSVRPPVLTFQPDPEFSEEARKAKFSGNVLVYLIVDEHGNPTHVRVQRGVGMGLDEKAVEAVRQYKFKPATEGGKPVKVDLTIDVNFQIF